MTKTLALGLAGLALLAGCGSETGERMRAVPAPADGHEAVWEGVVEAHAAIRVPATECALGDYHAGRFPSGVRFRQDGADFFAGSRMVATYLRERRAWFNYTGRAIRVANWCSG